MRVNFSDASAPTRDSMRAAAREREFVSLR
jgi:hypothetical protein